ncbi:Glutathione peroxidase 2 [Mortierella polycephala]|uniref:Glutathione peroxidase n=1 Tax=Mortierella polycephala TaxID=41804 RepID=A0A9P6QBZ2_9FUNG|nr:Glutathione peroxidase 2 [Mortierella polycephala]
MFIRKILKSHRPMQAWFANSSAKRASVFANQCYMLHHASAYVRPLSTSGKGNAFLLSPPSNTTQSSTMNGNFFSLNAKDSRHHDVKMSDFANKVVLIVNVASQCGFTPQYKELEKLYQDYKDKDFVVIGFPCNQFGGQEPGTEEEIESFCQVNFGVTFPLMAKIDVNGSNEDPIYTFLKSQKAGVFGLTRIKWNFEKFLIDKQGNIVQRYASTTRPSAIADDIKKIL